MMKQRRIKAMKRMVAVFLAVACLLPSIAVPVLATEELPGELTPIWDIPYERVPAKKGDSKEDVISPKAMSYFLEGYSSIKYHGNRIMTTVATTTTIQYVDHIITTTILERYLNGKWTVIDVNQDDSYNDCYSVTTLKYGLSAGYYYRARGWHTVVHNRVSERYDTCTEPLWLAP